MSLRIKTLLILGAVLVALFAALYLISQRVLAGSYADLESQAVARNVQRLRYSLDDELESLGRAVRDWSQWDDTYQFIQDQNQAFIDDNMGDVFLVNLGVNLMVYVDNSGEIVLAKAVDLVSEAETTLPTGLESELPADSPLFQHTSNDSVVTGILNLLEGPMLVAARPIVDTAGTAEPRGSLVFGRFLNAERVRMLSDALRLPVAAYSVSDPTLAGDFQTALANLSAADPIYVAPLDDQTISGYTQLSDIEGSPMLVLRVDQPRDIAAQGQSAISFFLLLLAVVGFVFAIAALVLLERLVMNPLTRLERDLRQITSSGDIAERVSVAGNDEIATVGGHVNSMLDALEKAQLRANENTYRLSAIIKSAPIILWAVDEQGVFTLLEGKGLNILKIDGRNALGKPAAEVFKNVPQVLEELRRASRGENIESILPVREYTFDARYTALRDRNNRVTGVIGVLTDITERVLAERALGDAYENLNTQNEKRERVLEFLRSTLTIMKDTVQRGAPHQELAEYLDFAGQQVEALR